MENFIGNIQVANLMDLTQETVSEFYSSETDGIMHLKGMLHKLIPEKKLRSWYKSRANSFEIKREKYIENNQTVSVVHNGSFANSICMDNVDDLALHDLYHEIRSQVGLLSDQPFAQVDRLETKLIHYPVSKLGVGAHKDMSSNVNLIVLMTMFGSSCFYTADDKQGLNEKVYNVESGDIVLMRGPRKPEENSLRTIHYIKEVTQERLVFVCREIDEPIEAIINKNNWRGF